MSEFNNQAAWLDGKGARLRIGPSVVGKPGAGEMLVRNHAWAINPADWKIQTLDVLLQKYPAILGFDIAGEVVAVGDAADGFKVGDRVIAHPLGLQTKRHVEDGFQSYTIVQRRATVKLPASMRFEEGVELPLAILTASAALYNAEHLRLPIPSAEPTRTCQTLLVWGGSSNVGNAAIQLAVASGLEVVAVASLRNKHLAEQAGSTTVFDHADPDIVGKIVEYLRSKSLVGAFDAIGSIEATKSTAEVLAQLGGGKLRAVFNRFATVDATVEAKQVQAVSVFLSEPAIGKAVWEGFLPGALERGQIKPLLHTVIAGKGVESIQHGIDMVKAGVSASKVVVLA